MVGRHVTARNYFYRKDCYYAERDLLAIAEFLLKFIMPYPT